MSNGAPYCEGEGQREHRMKWVTRARPKTDPHRVSVADERASFVYDALYAWCQQQIAAGPA